MDENQTIFDTLNSDITDGKKRELLKRYLFEQLDKRNSDLRQASAIAYTIAGLLSTKFAASLSKNDPYLRILDLAGQLELPERHRGDATWDQLRELINKL